MGCFPLRYTAAEIDICLTIIVHQHGRIKKPFYVTAVFHIPADQALTQLIPERSDRTVGTYHSDPAAVIRKIQEELRLSVNHLPRCCRCPGIFRPGRHTIFSGYPDLTMICKIDHILRGNHINTGDLAVTVLFDLLCRIVLVCIRGHIEIHSILIYHRKRISSVMLFYDRIAVLYSFVTLCEFQSPEVFRIIHLFFLLCRIVCYFPGISCRSRFRFCDRCNITICRSIL